MTKLPRNFKRKIREAKKVIAELKKQQDKIFLNLCSELNVGKLSKQECCLVDQEWSRLHNTKLYERSKNLYAH